MKKSWWIGLSIILFLMNMYLVVKLKNLKKNSFLGPISLKDSNGEIHFPSELSFITLIIYFSENSCMECMKESYYWNKLFKDLQTEEIFVVGIIPKKDDIEKIKERNKILFPVYQDKDGKFAKSFHISLTPFKILMDMWGNFLYMSQTQSGQDKHENFYFEVLEHLRKVRLKEEMQRISR